MKLDLGGRGAEDEAAEMEVVASAAAAAAAGTVAFLSGGDELHAPGVVSLSGSSVGTDAGCSVFSERVPLAPLASLLLRAGRLPLSAAGRLRARPPSETVRPPRAGLLVVLLGGMASPVVVVKVFSFGLGLARSFLGLDTSPHWEMVPEKKKKSLMLAV